MTTPTDPQLLASMYLTAKERVLRAGYAEEIDWQTDIAFSRWDESTFLRESAWVVLSSGFREEVLRRCFLNVSAAFLHWVNADSILAQMESCRANALHAFGNVRKIDAILKIVCRVAEDGIESIREEVKNRGIAFIQELPFMGPTTSCHLAKNLGITIVKPDRHLNRIAIKVGYDSPDRMCREISKIVGDSLAVIDIVFWRYATITKNYDLDSLS